MLCIILHSSRSVIQTVDIEWRRPAKISHHCVKDSHFQTNGRDLLIFELHLGKKPFVNWNCFFPPFSDPLISPLYRGPSVAKKRKEKKKKPPRVFSIGLIVLLFPGHICQQALSAATRTHPITFQFEGRWIDGRKHRWIDRLDGSVKWNISLALHVQLNVLWRLQAETVSQMKWKIRRNSRKFFHD